MERLKTSGPAARRSADRAQFDSLAANSNNLQIAHSPAKLQDRRAVLCLEEERR
jgi:hypothetical protein